MSDRTNLLFKGLHVVAYIIFIGLCIEAGALLVNFFFSIFKPVAVHNLYQKLDLSDIYNSSRWVFFAIYSFILSISLLKAYLFYAVIVLVGKIDLSRPFSSYVSKQITSISYYTFAIGLVGLITRQTSRILWHRSYNLDALDRFWTDSEAFILMAAVIYIIASIFAKGVELQNENDLTV